MGLSDPVVIIGPMSDERVLHRIAARRHGLASRSDLRRAGFSDRQIARRVESGRLVRVAPAVFDVAPGSPHPRRRLHAAVLTTGGLASHRSAAWLLGLVADEPRRHEVTLPPGRSVRNPAALVHRSETLERRDRTRVDGIATTNAYRTLFDLGAVVAAVVVDDALNRALANRLVTVGGIEQRFAATTWRGCRGAGALRAALAHHGIGAAPTESLLETMIVRAVRAGRLPPPVRQHVVRVAGRRYRLDLAWPEAKVFVEGDGFAAHGSPAAFERDRQRQNALVAAGWLPLRYTWRDVREGSPRTIVAQIAEVLGRRCA